MDRRGAKDTALLLLDESASAAPTGSAITACWNATQAKPGIQSIPVLAEARSLASRTEYLNWLHTLAQYKIDGQSLDSALRWDDATVSYWTLSAIAEKSPLKSAGIYRIFKLRALEHLYLESACKGLVYRGPDQCLAGVLAEWMDQLGHAFSFEPTKVARQPKSNGAKHVVNAFSYFASRCWRMYRLTLQSLWSANPAPDGNARVNVFTYFPNIHADKARLNRFRSRYWEGLHDVIAQTASATNWIWLFADSTEYSYAGMLDFAGRCNQNGQDRHIAIEQFASPRVLVRTLWRYLRLCLARTKITGTRRAFKLDGSAINFFQILEYDWCDSIFGRGAMANAWHISLFESMSRKLPVAATNLYLLENQPWELALIGALRKENCGPTIGHQHALPAPLNLRYLPLPDAPVPDWIVVGGPGPRRIVAEAGMDTSCLIECEALRYQYLAGATCKTGGEALLVITSLLPGETRFQLEMLTAAKRNGGLARFARILVKPHPFLPVEPILVTIGAEGLFEITQLALAQLWPVAAAAFAANSTSAAVEALYMRVPLVIASAGNALNLSILLGEHGIEMVASADELPTALDRATRCVKTPELLLLDPALPRWRALLAKVAR